MNEFLSNNPFVVCSEELNYVKHELAREGDNVRVKHKTGVILYKATQDRSGLRTCVHTSADSVSTLPTLLSGFYLVGGGGGGGRRGSFSPKHSFFPLKISII